MRDEYTQSVERVRQWSMSNARIQEAIRNHGTADFGPWLLLDGTWLGGGPTHHDVGHVHDFMNETGSVRVYRRGDYLAIEMAAAPTVDQMREINRLAKQAGSLEVDLTESNDRVRQLGTRIVESPDNENLADLWAWVDGVFEWQT